MVSLTWPDFIIVLVLVGFGVFGFVLGMIQVVGGLVGLVAGTWLANQWHLPLGKWLANVLPVSPRISSLLAFILILVVVQRAMALGFYWLGRMLRLLRFIPFFKSFNRIAGGLLGLLEGALLLGFILQMAHASHLPGLESWSRQSLLFPWLVSLVEVAQRVLPWLNLPAQKPPPYDIPLVV
jgi:membrane protein required for colicin V production